jgi:hypothetical protein
LRFIENGFAPDAQNLRVHVFSQIATSKVTIEMSIPDSVESCEASISILLNGLSRIATFQVARQP